MDARQDIKGRQAAAGTQVLRTFQFYILTTDFHGFASRKHVWRVIMVKKRTHTMIISRESPRYIKGGIVRTDRYTQINNGIYGIRLKLSACLLACLPPPLHRYPKDNIITMMDSRKMELLFRHLIFPTKSCRVFCTPTPTGRHSKP